MNDKLKQKAGYTQGPWAAVQDDDTDGDWIIKHEDWGVIVYVHSNASVFDDDSSEHEAQRIIEDEEAEANALLISCAPEMLQILEHIQAMGTVDVSKIIAKAKGITP